jgi:hypothetical protein
MRATHMVSRIARRMQRTVQYEAQFSSALSRTPRIRHAVAALAAMVGAPPRPRPALLDATTRELLPEVRDAVCAAWRRFRNPGQGGITADGLKALFALWSDQANSSAAQERRARRVLAKYATTPGATSEVLTEVGFLKYVQFIVLLLPSRAWDLLQTMAPGLASAHAPSTGGGAGAGAGAPPPLSVDAGALAAPERLAAPDDLPEKCAAQLRSREFIESVVRYDESAAYGELVALLSRDDAATSDAVVAALIEQCATLLRVASGQRNYRAAPPGALLYTQLGLVCTAIARVLAVADALQRERSEIVVGGLLALAAEQRDARDAAAGRMPLMCLIASLVALREGAPLVRATLDARPAAWRWMLPWLADTTCIAGLAQEKAATLTKLLVAHREALVAESVDDRAALDWLSPPPPVLSAALLRPRSAAAAAAESLPLLSIRVCDAGCDEVNGVYVADSTESGERQRWTKIDTPTKVGAYVLKPDDRVRLFRCRLSSHGYAWYISATGPSSGVNTDVDFYELPQPHRGAHIVPPPRGWVLSQGTTVYARHPPPTVHRAPEWLRLNELRVVRRPTAERYPPQPPVTRAAPFADLQLANIDHRGSESSEDSTLAARPGSL